jgi:hypothetical protein
MITWRASEGRAVPARTVHALGDGGAIRDWLVSPSWRASCDADLATLLRADGPPWGADGRWTLTQGPEVAPLKERLYQRRPLVTGQALPAVEEGGPVSWVAPGGTAVDEGTWRRVHTCADGLVDWSDFCFRPEYRHAVAATCLEVDQPEWRDIEVACTGPVAVWLGSAPIGIFTDISYMEPASHSVRVRLGSGVTPLVIATWQAGFREVRHVARVAVHGLPARVVIPSPDADERASAIAERVLEAVAVDSWAVAGDEVGLSGPAGVALRITRPGDVVGQVIVLDKGRGVYRLGETVLGETVLGETVLSVRVDDPRCPVTRELPVAMLPPRVRSVPEGDDPAVWRREVLEHVSGGAAGVARALASGRIEHEDLERPLSMLGNRADCADFEAVALLNLWHADAPWPAGLRESAKRALLGFKYWIDQPGLDAMCYFTENHQLVFHTAELLAGQAFTGETFARRARSGARRKHGQAGVAARRSGHGVRGDGRVRRPGRFVSGFVAALAEPSFRNGVAWTSRDGHLLELSEVFTVDGAPPDIGADGRPDTGVHLDNPACVARLGDDVLRARHGGHTMTLDIARGRRLS